MTDIFASYLERYRSSRQLQATSWYTVGTFAEKGIAFLFTFVFAYLLTPDEFGIVSVFLTWVALLTPIVTVNIYASVQRAKFDTHEEEFKDFVSSILTFGTLTAALALLIAIILPDDWIVSIFGMSNELVLLAFLVPLFILSIQTYMNVWKVNYQYRSATIVAFFRNLLRLLLSSILIILFIQFVLGDPALGRILGIVIIEALLGITLFIKAQRKGKERFNYRHWKYGISYSAPLILHTISGVVIAQFDRVLIAQFLGASAAGSYAFAYQISDPIRLLWLATNAAWVPWFFEKMKNNDVKQINKRSREYIYAFTLITAMAMIVLPLLFSLLAPSAYQGSLKIMPLIMTGGFLTFLYSFYANVGFYEKKTIYISVATVLAAFINVILNVLFLGQFGIMVAAWATLVAYFFLFVFHYFVATFILNRKDLYSLKQVLLMMGFIIALAIGLTLII